MPEKFSAYASKVCDQLRWKKAHPIIKREIETHLCDQYDNLVRNGMSEADAVDESLRITGDAVEIGTNLDRIHRPKPSWCLLILTAVLVLMGLAIKAFITYDVDYPNELPKMLIATAMGFVCLFTAYFVDFTLIGKWPFFFYAASILAVICLMKFHVGITQYSTLGPVYLTLFMPVGFAALLYKLREKHYCGMLIAFGGLAIEIICCLLIPSFSATITIAVSGFTLLAVAAFGNWFRIGKLRSLIILGSIALLCAVTTVFSIWNSAYLSERVLYAFHPDLDPTGRGWLGIMIHEILSGAKFFGTGELGRYALETPMMISETPMLLVYLTYRVGWIAYIIILAVFAAFFAVAIHKCLLQKNMLGRMVTLAVISTLGIQVLQYLIWSTGFLLVEGISLPLVSYGNTALVLNLALIGVMLSVFRTGSLVRDKSLPAHSKSAWKDHVRWNDGELTISFKKKIVS